MSLSRPKVQLDEQSFQGLLAAAYTIQEHADLLKQVTKVSRKAAQEPCAAAPGICGNCAAPMQEDESRCGRCGWEESRQGERPEPTGATHWEISQEHGTGQEPIGTEAETAAPPIEVKHTLLAIPLATTEDNWLTEANQGSVGRWSALLNLRQRLRDRRADLYLGLSVLVAVVALLWPTSASPQKPRLDPWQRILVELGIAEAPAPQIHYRGDPSIQVWVDPHTALYYCPGDEPYGKAPDGRLTSQRDAQADQFEPAYRAACN
jgi:hypothetical protein